MSGFDTSRPGIVAMAKQHGSILRGFGPPVPQAGVVGDLYIDNLTFRMFEKRDINGLDDWGHFLFFVPPLYKYSLKWFGASAPDNTLGVPGDYFMQWAGYDNYGMNPLIWGPKLWTGWPENGDGPGTVIADQRTGVYPLGLLDEGPVKTDMMLNQLIAIGIFDEYVFRSRLQIRVIRFAAWYGFWSVSGVDINALYTAEDRHAI
jgi:hypothetical protein